jgi:hypothetical protein
MYGKLALFIFAAWAGHAVSTITDPTTHILLEAYTGSETEFLTPQALDAESPCACSSQAGV